MTLLIVPPPHFRKQTSLINDLKSLGLTSNLQFCLDYGDINCYPGSGQTVVDLAGVANFVLGDTSSSEPTKDPTFAGTAGKETSGEYFRSPDFTYYNSTPSSTFTNSLYQDSALFSFVGWCRLAQLDPTFGDSIWQSVSTGTGIGIGSAVSPLGDFGLTVFNGASGVCNISSGLTAIAGAMTFYGFSFDEAAGTWVAQVNGSQTSGSGKTYAGPAGNAGLAFKIGATNDPSGGYSGDIANSAGWSRKLSAAEMDGVFQATRSKFGI